jgi:hypothetical protein
MKIVGWKQPNRLPKPGTEVALTEAATKAGIKPAKPSSKKRRPRLKAL